MHLIILERCQSGLLCSFAKAVGLNRPREFESPPLRAYKISRLYGGIILCVEGERANYLALVEIRTTEHVRTAVSTASWWSARGVQRHDERRDRISPSFCLTLIIVYDGVQWV